MKGNERNLIWAKGRSATSDTFIHSGRYFADLVGIQGTACADNVLYDYHPSVGEIHRARDATFPDIVIN